MAQLSFSGLDELMLSMREIAEIPDEVQDEMLEAEAQIVAEAIRGEAAKLGIGYDAKNENERHTSETNKLPGQTQNYATGGLARSVKVGKVKAVKGQRQKYIYFAGSRKRGKTRTRNAEIAFLNEYGTRTINARGFVKAAHKKVEAAAVQAAAAVYNRWLESKGL